MTDNKIVKHGKIDNTTLKNKVDKLTDAFFDNRYILYQHLHNSYNMLIVNIVNYLETSENLFDENRIDNILYRYRFKFSNILVRPPLKEDGIRRLYPHEARDSNMTYSLKIIGNIQQIQEVYDLSSRKTISTKVVGEAKNEVILILPCMVRSKYCSLSNTNHKSKDCEYDPGGYFIINGSEKIILCLERMIQNKPIVFYKKDGDNENYKVKINSKSNNPNVMMQSIEILIDRYTNINIKVPILNEISVFVLMRVLGLESDREIMNCIIYNEKDTEMINILKLAIDNSKQDGKKSITTKEDAVLSLMNKLRVVKKYMNGDKKLQQTEKKEHLFALLRNAFMPHIDTDKHNDVLKTKALFLGYMINKLLNTYLRRKDYPPDDRDSFVNKRIDTQGELTFDLVKQGFKKNLNECNKFHKKRTGSNHSNPINIISKLKPSNIEQGIKSAMMTGNWGKKKGVAQMYQRLTFLQALSFLRRVDASSGSSSSTMKLTGPRHYHPSQVGYLCLTGDTEILMADSSIKLIKDVKDGDSVITLDTETMTEITTPIKNWFKKDCDKLLKVTTISGREIKCTPEHKLLTKVGDKYEMVEVGKMTTDNYLIVRHAPKYIPLDKETKLIIKKEDIIEQYRFELLELGYLDREIPQNKLEILARLIGLNVTDGHIGKRKDKNYYDCEFSVGEEKDTLDLLDDIMKLGFGTPCICRSITKYTDKNNGKVTVYKTWKVSKNGPFAYLMYHLGAFEGKKTEMKRKMPEWIMNANNGIKREFISGFIAGDGCRLSMNKYVDTYKISCGGVRQICSKNTLDDTLNYLKQISEIITEFNIENKVMHYGVKNENNNEEEEEEEEETDDDDNKYEKYSCAICFSQTYENLEKYSDIVNFRYCNEKRRKSALTMEYIKHKNEYSNKMNKIYDKIIELYKNRNKPRKIEEILKCEYNVVKRIVTNYAKNKKPKARQLSTNKCESYENFVKKFKYIEGLGLVIKIRTIEEIDSEPVYDFETSFSTHNFIADSIRTSNCAVESPEHSNIGLIKNLALMATIITSPKNEVYNVYEHILKNKIFIHMNNFQPAQFSVLTKVFLDGEWIGFTEKPFQFQTELLRMKRNNIMLNTNSVTFNSIYNEIRINTDTGRLSRPLLRVEKNELVATPRMIDDIMSNKEYDGMNKWELFMSHYPDAVEYVDMEEQYFHLIATKLDKITEMKNREKNIYPDTNEPIVNRYDESLIERYSHCEFDPSMLLGIIAANIPFANHNFGSRNIYQYAQGKQAMSLYASNYKIRLDITFILYNVQRPLVNTKASKYIHTDVLPCGENCYVLIGCYSGYNQDDSIIMNQTAIDRGLFRSISLKKWDSKIERNQSTSQVDIFRKPELETLVGSRNANYDKLNDRGYVPEETFIQNNDIIIGKITPIQPVPGSNKHFKDSSTMYKSHEPAIVDKVFHNIQNSEGYDMIKIRTRSERIPKIGDKFCCLTSDHEVLTTCGWKFINEIKTTDKVACLMENDILEYHNPTATQEYDCHEDLYKIKSNQIDLVVTKNHRMYVGAEKNTKYKIEKAEDIYGKRKRYKKNVENYNPGKEITHITFKSKKEGKIEYKIEPWLTFFGIWIAEGCAPKASDDIRIAVHKQRVKDDLERVFEEMNIHYTKQKDNANDDIRNSWRITTHKHLIKYFAKLSVGSINKSLPKWVWELNQKQCRILIDGMMCGDGHIMENGTGRYDTSSTQLADDFQRLCLHAGWSCNKLIKYKAGHESVKQDGYVIKSTVDAYRLTIIKSQNNPLVNKNITKTGENRHDSYINFNDPELANCIKNKVYCCTVPENGIIYVKRNGYCVWSGNSRHGQKGVIGLTMHESDLPFTKYGIVPDIIINPNAIPSRMTVAHLMECLYGKVACFKGIECDATAFKKSNLSDVMDALESFGYKRDGTEMMYSGITGNRINHDFFFGPTYYQRLRHLVMDKMHCIRIKDTEVLTLKGWKKYGEFKKKDKLATLEDGKLVYRNPTEIFSYPEFEGKMYHISNASIDLDVTMKHRMWVSKLYGRKQEWQDHDFEYAKDIIGKQRRYKKDAEWESPNYQLTLQKFTDKKNNKYDNKQVDMNSWITFFGIWIAEGWANESNIQIAVHKQRVKDALYPALQTLGYEFKVKNDCLRACDKQLHNYMKQFSLGAPNKYLPKWCFELSKEQSQLLVHSMQLGDGYFCKETTASWYSTASTVLADDFQRLCLHAGYAANKHLHIKAGTNTVIIRGKEVTNNYDIWRISVMKTKTCPGVNHGHTKTQDVQEEKVYDYKGAVFCVEVPSGVFMIRQNGKPCWTGNSRARGPVTMLTRQAPEGRSKDGGLKCGEMERDTIISYGMSKFMKERFVDIADKYSCYVCDICGLFAQRIVKIENSPVPQKGDSYVCIGCKNETKITKIVIPYAFKLLIQELMSINIAPRIRTKKYEF